MELQSFPLLISFFFNCVLSCGSRSNEIPKFRVLPQMTTVDETIATITIEISMKNIIGASAYGIYLSNSTVPHKEFRYSTIEDDTKPVNTEIITLLKLDDTITYFYVQLNSLHQCCDEKLVLAYSRKCVEDKNSKTFNISKELDWRNVCQNTQNNNCAVKSENIVKGKFEEKTNWQMCDINNISLSTTEAAVNDKKAKVDALRNSDNKLTLNVSDSIKDQNHDINYGVGEVVTFTVNPAPDSYILCEIRKGSYTFVYIKGKTNESMQFRVVMAKFDDGTEMRLRQNHVTLHVFFRLDLKREQREVIYDDDMVSPVPETLIFKRASQINYTCTGHYYKHWLRLKNNSIDTTIHLPKSPNSSKLVLNHQLAKSDDEAVYICLGYEIVNVGDGKLSLNRRISKPIYLLMDPTQAIVEEELDSIDDCTLCGNNITMVCLICGGLVTVALVVFIWIYARKRRRIPHGVETYACANTVQYVDLQTMSSNNSMRWKVDETPYAQIIGVLAPTKR